VSFQLLAYSVKFYVFSKNIKAMKEETELQLQKQLIVLMAPRHNTGKNII
jgi:hypothetical protein